MSILNILLALLLLVSIGTLVVGILKRHWLIIAIPSGILFVVLVFSIFGMVGLPFSNSPSGNIISTYTHSTAPSFFESMARGFASLLFMLVPLGFSVYIAVLVIKVLTRLIKALDIYINKNR